MVRIILNNVIAWDSAVSRRIFRLTGRRLLDHVMYWSSRVGDGYIYAVIILFMFFIDIHLAPRIVIAGAIAFALELSVQVLVKNKFKRNRPFEKIGEIRSLINPPDKFSFPSGHTAAAFLMAWLLGHFFPIVTIPAFLFATAIGFSRIYNGLHFPSDVIAGMFLGIVCAQIGILCV